MRSTYSKPPSGAGRLATSCTLLQMELVEVSGGFLQIPPLSHHTLSDFLAGQDCIIRKTMHRRSQLRTGVD